MKLLIFTFIFLLAISVKKTSAACGNNIVEIGEQCDNTTPGTCCLSSCINATSANVINTSPLTLTVSAPVGANLIVSAATLQLVTTVGANLNYPVSYTVVSYTPSFTTYVPVTPTVFTYNNAANRLEYTFGWAGSYIVVLASTYCSPNGTLFFTRTITNPAYAVAVSGTMPLSTALCTSDATVRDRSTTRCDCSVNTCTRGMSRSSAACWLGYTDCTSACPDVRQAKPQTFTLQAQFLFATGTTRRCSTLLIAIPCICPAICGDGLVDTGEVCDNPVAGSCCTNNCQNTTTPTTTIPASASITLSSAATQSFSTMQLTGTSNFVLDIQVVSVSGVAGLSATTTTSNVVFNSVFTGTATVVFRTVFCVQTNVSFIFTRIVTMNSCGNSLTNPGEQCDSPTIIGSCCTSSCTNATTLNVVNPSPATLSVSVTSTTQTYLTASALQLSTTGTNYPVWYSVVSAVPSVLTYAPPNPPVFTYDNNLGRLNFVRGWANVYIVTIASIFCNSTGGALYYTRTITNPAFSACSPAGFPASGALCSSAPATNIFQSTRCDCSINQCVAGGTSANSGTTCSIGYPTCALACTDLLVTKPRSFTVVPRFSLLCSGSTSCTGGTTLSCTCPPLCNDGIQDAGEQCDAPYAESCCTSTCSNTTAPTTAIASNASVTVPSSTTQSHSALLLNGTSNYVPLFKLSGITGLPGVTATIDTSNVYFNTVFSGTVTLSLYTIFCPQTNTILNFTRVITMNSCGNTVIDPGEICDTASCCTELTCMPRSPVDIGNGDPLFAILQPTAQTITWSDLQLTTYQQYGAVYQIVSYGPMDCATYIPKGNVDLRVIASGFAFSVPWAGNYTVNISLTLCNNTYYYTRQLYLPSFSSPSQASQFGVTRAFCTIDLKFPGDTLCDCRVTFCYTYVNVSGRCQFGFASSPCLFLACPKTCSSVVTYRWDGFSTSDCNFNYAPGQTQPCCPVCNDGHLDKGEICDSGAGSGSNTDLGSCCGAGCVLPSNAYPLTKSITLASCTTSVSLATTATGLSLSGSSPNYGISYMIANISGQPGVGATMTPTTFTFNTTFTGTVIVTIYTIYCNDTGASFVYTRSITSPVCCGNGVINPGEDCDLGTGVNGVSTNCCSSTCTFIPSSSNQVCRTSAGPCDVAETCAGTSSSCPAHVLLPSTTMCRNVSGPCDKAEFCTGSLSTCPSDSFVNSGTICRNTSNVCDIAATCTGAAATCPVNGFASTSVVCRASTDICDPQETCTGSSYSCPANVFSASSVQCRASTGICDPAEFCIFNNASCPSDTFLPQSSVCRNAVSICDVTEFCTGTTGPCPADVFQPSGTLCRANVSICDIPEVCNGITTTCPSDAFAPSTITCRPSLSTCDLEEKCTGSSSSCPVDSFASSSTLCRASIDICDAPEFCVFNNVSCPSDDYYNASIVCRNSAGSCDSVEYCTGVSVTCPLDSYQASGFTCRPVAGICDIPEVCTGSSVTCPIDAFKQNTIICRNQSGACDIPEYCSGSTATCSADFYATNGTVCRPIVDVCDVSEVCDGVTPTCPSDVLALNGTICRASAGICDSIEVCSGVSVSCPPNVFVDSATICNPSQGACDPAESCTGSSALCPTNILTANGVICDASNGLCESDAQCDGATPLCPSKNFYNTTIVCRANGGLCDVPEFCTGSAAACPVNVFQPSTHICSASTGSCMPNSYCGGSDATCTVLSLYNSTVVCRPSIGRCDIDDFCTGSSPSCSSDSVQPSGYVCDAQTPDNTCRVNTTCSGLNGVCTPTYLSASSSCHFDSNYCYTDTCTTGPNSSTVCVRGSPINYDDGLYCNGVETCDSTTGLKISGVPVSCNDGSTCTTDTCSNAQASCVYTPIANSVGPCGGGLGACTPGNYSCNGAPSTPVITCVGAVLPVTEVCFNGIDDNCNGQIDEFCVGIPCNVTQDCYNRLNLTQCVSAVCTLGQCIVSNLNASVPCNDGRKCTRNDMCDGLGACVGTPITCDDQNDCTQDSCSEVFGQCVFNSTVNDGNPCIYDIYTESNRPLSRNFYDACVAESQCANGQCVITATLDCPVTSECEAQVCNLDAGRCEDAFLSGKPCQIGDVCELNGVCIDGQGCVTAPRICDDFITCTVDTCVQRGGDPCNHAIAAGFCLINGQCYSSGTQNPYDPCRSCRPTLSTSDWSNTAGSVSCDDHDLCTVNDVCAFGVCTGVSVNCSVYNDQCTTSVCIRGQCVSEISNVGGTCNDTLACTTNDKCSNSGVCTGTSLNCAQYSTQCSVYSCSETGGGCVADPIDDYTRCQTSTDLCDGYEYCMDGMCVAGEPLSCTTNDVCLLASCDPVLGCVMSPRTNSICNDSNACTIGDTCGNDGLCYPGNGILDCDDGNPCTYDSCDTVQGCLHTTLSSCTTCSVDEDCDSTFCQTATCVSGSCVYNALLAGTSCGSDNACSRNDYCTDSGVCVTLIPEVCDDHNVCTLDSCTPGFGCVFTPLTATSCDDNDLCTINDQCSNGECTGTPHTCPSNTECLDYACQVIAGTPTCIGVPKNLGGFCSSSDLCQVNGKCLSSGVCSTVNTSCPATTECTLDYTCSGGSCMPVHASTGTHCNRKDLCTPWSCDGTGLCLANTSATKVCPFNSSVAQCQREPVCIPHTGECYPQYRDDGSSCDDGNLCTAFDSCHAGICLGEEYYNCTNDPATLDCFGPPLCHPVNGCYRESLPDGEPCYYNDGCNTLSVCQSGVCTDPLLTMPCKTDDPCTVATCIPGLACVEMPNELDGVGCDLVNLCYTLGTCTSGTCQGATVIPCSDALGCGVSYCSPEEGCLFLGNEDCHTCTIASDCPYLPCKSASCPAGTCTYSANDAALSGCNDNLFCNGEEICSQGTCVLGKSVECNDNDDDDDNTCTTTHCDNSLGACVYTPIAVNTSCVSTTDKCALSSHCNALGECVTTSRASCTFTEPCRVSLGCNATTGGCSSDILVDGSECTPNDPCAGPGTCLSGVCIYATTMNCSSFEGDFCSQSFTCNRQTGACVGNQYTPISCSDDSACTLGDVCLANGTCVAGVYSPCEFTVHDEDCQYILCELDGSCSVHDYTDGTSCSTDMPTGGCSGVDTCLSGTCIRSYSPGTLCRPSDSSGCDEDDFCIMGNDYCPEDSKQASGTLCTPTVFCSAPTGECSNDGHCLVNQPRDCTVNDSPCTIGVCDELSMSCLTQLRPENEACEAPDLPCVEHSGCYFGYCLAYAAPSRVNCSDGNSCTSDDHCSGVDETCLPGEIVNCSSSMQNADCVNAICNVTTGNCEFDPINEGGACNADDNLCTMGDNCQAGVCIAGPGVDCSYLDSPCQRGICSSATTCDVEVLSRECSPDYCTGNCTAPIEWWTVHSSHYPTNGLFTWPGNFETQTLCSQTYYDWSQQPYGDNAWLSLFQQWLGASLNQMNGACLPNSTSTAVNNAFTLLSSCDTDTIFFTNSTASSYRSLLYNIYAYNSGVHGPGLCDPGYCFHDELATAQCLFIAVPYI